MTNVVRIIGHGHLSPEHPAGLLEWAQRLSDSAEQLSIAAAGPGAAAAIASALGHLEAALEHLELGIDEMEGVARTRLAHATVVLGDPWNDVVVARAAHDFEELARALARARLACEKVRRTTGPLLAELTAV